MTKQKKEPKVAIVYDPLFKYGGAEAQLKYMFKAFPNAEFYTAYYDTEFVEEQVIKDVLGDRKIHKSFMQYLPFKWKLRELYFLFLPLAYRFFNFRNYDVVISHTISFAKFVRPPKGVVHVCSCMSPPKFFWEKDGRTMRKNPFKGVRKFLYSFYAFFMDTFLEDIWKYWDKNAANRCDKIFGNSESVKKRIKKYYEMDADVIYPPVEVSEIKKKKLLNRRENWFLYIGRIETYKGVDLAIKAAVKAGVPLKVAGKGSDLKSMQELVKKLNAKGSVKFLGFVSEEEKIDLLMRCKALIFPVRKEDFGIVPVEANAAGAPVIAYKEGGPLETISESNPKTGKFFDKYTVKELSSVLKKFNPDKYDPVNCRKQADNFAAEIFVYKLQNYVEDVLQDN